MSFETLRTVAAIRQQVGEWKRDGLSVGLVPTMGALHAGHLSLVDQIARQADRVVVSLFVNPTQFAEGEDFDSYPRTEPQDAAKLQATPTDALYVPSAAEVYAPGFATEIAIAGPALGLESDARPHFFAGVALVVAKLFLQCQPDMAIFGEKDYQQLLVIRRMVQDLNMPVQVLAGATMREADGLAMSSRNRYLDDGQRKIAGKLNLVLAGLCETIRNSKDDGKNDSENVNRAVEEATHELLAAGFSQVDYLAIKDADSLQDVTPQTTSRRALVAARIGDMRLIDNMPVED